MAKLETQINQIYLTHPEIKTSIQILHDETVNQASHIFLIAEIKGVKRKTEEQDLNKICDIILTAFRSNKKLPAETLFESSLAEINENLADFAHKGHRSWLGKFSACIALKNADNLYLANTGRAVALLRRRTEISEILSSEKKSPLPLKTFQNFTMGKVKDTDCLITTFNNLFDYVSLPLFIKTLNESTTERSIKHFSQILKDSGGTESFACFILQFIRPDAIPVQSELPPLEEIYAPLPETETLETKSPKPYLRAISEAVYSKIRSLRASPLQMRLPRLSVPRPKNWRHLSTARKFLLLSFLIFLLVFAANIAAFGINLSNKKHRDKVEAQIAALTNLLHESEGALIYKNNDQAFKFLNEAWAEFEKLQTLEPEQAAEIQPIIQDLSDKVNRISFVSQPQTVAELKFEPDFLVRAGSGFLIATRDSKSLAYLDDQNHARNIFLINNPQESLRGVAHVPELGHVLLTDKNIYRVNEAQKQVELLKPLPNTDAIGLKLASSRLYTANKTSGQVLRFNLSQNSLSDPQSALKAPGQFADLVDFGVDKDIYLLFPSEIKKFVNGAEQTFAQTALSEPLTSGSKLQVASNIYVLEASKNRLLIYNKQGSILNQIIFLDGKDLSDFYVDEQQRNIFVLDGNKLLRITF